jgi:hypothetical protein
MMVGEMEDGREGAGAIDGGAPVPEVADEGVAAGAPFTCANAIAGRVTAHQTVRESAPTRTTNSVAIRSDRFAPALATEMWLPSVLITRARREVVAGIFAPLTGEFLKADGARPQSRHGTTAVVVVHPQLRHRATPQLHGDCYWSTGTNSTRRFCARPSAVLLVATKWVLPKPCGINWLAGIPLSSR